MTQDSVLLAEFLLPLKDDDTVIDLGTGTGIIPLLIAWRSGVSRIVGVEIEDESAEVARRNVHENGLPGRITILKEDWRKLDDIYPPGSFSVVACNPPYIKKGEGRVSPYRERALARYELMGTLEDLIGISAYLVRDDGRICYIYPTSRFTELLEGFGKVGLRPAKIRFIHTRKGKGAKLFLVEARKRGGLILEEPLHI